MKTEDISKNAKEVNKTKDIVNNTMRDNKTPANANTIEVKITRKFLIKNTTQSDIEEAKNSDAEETNHVENVNIDDKYFGRVPIMGRKGCVLLDG